MNGRTKSHDTWILGINSAYHEPSACLIRNGRIIAAVEEERFNRIRHGKQADLRNPHWLPEQAIRWCLSEAGINANAISSIGYSFAPELRLASNIAVDHETLPGGAGTREGEEYFFSLFREIPSRLSLLLECDVRDRFRWIEHHLCHAASAFFVSPFDKAAVMSVDGIGEVATTWLGVGIDNRLQKLREHRYPNSIGLLWTKMSRFLGFGDYGQWKVMALGAYGDPDPYYDALRSFVSYDEAGDFAIAGEILQYRVDRYDALESLLGEARQAGGSIEDRHQDIAAALQKVTNEILLGLARWLRAETGCSKLCVAGGVALNCIANREIIEGAGYEDLFVQPAANDAGTALGACYSLWHETLGRERTQVMDHAYLGPSFTSQTESLVAQLNSECVLSVTNLHVDIAKWLSQGDTVAVYQGRIEFGPRALGNRSILADPRRPEIVDILNERVKRREWFRPFGASVMDERASEWFAMDRRTAADRFMLVAYPLRAEKMGTVPAVTHIDGTTRIQCVDPASNPLLYGTILQFEHLTGVPMILNTSFNEDEPIVCTPIEALRTALSSGVDYLVLENTAIALNRCDSFVASLIGARPKVGCTLPDREKLQFASVLQALKPMEQAPEGSCDPVTDDVRRAFMSR